MATITELRERAAAARAKADAVKLSAEEREIAALIDEEEQAKRDERAALSDRRRIGLKGREDAARAKAGKAYLVRGVDMIDYLPPECDLADVPNEGLFVVRSPTKAAYAAMQSAMESKVQTQAEFAADLVCASTVDPDVSGPDAGGALGIALRNFVDDPRFAGAVIQMANVITDLNGTKIKEAKRGGK